MNGIEAIVSSLESTGQMLEGFISDLSDNDLLVCPVEGANHIAWQIGHLISSERFIMEGNLPGAQYAPLPANFENVHGRESTTKNSNQGFLSKDTYIDLFRKTRAASIQAVKALKDTDLENPTTGRLAAKAPTVGKLYLLASHHILMHIGQFSVVRRKLGKPVLF